MMRYSPVIRPSSQAVWLLLAYLVLGWGSCAQAVVLWSDLGDTLVHESGPGVDILGGAVERDDKSADVLYFKFHVDMLSDVNTEEYFAGFELFEGSQERLGIGNSLKAWAYSAFNTAETGPDNKIAGDLDLHSSRPEPSTSAGNFLTYELPRRGIDSTIVFKVQYVPGGDDLVTVWLNPDLSPGATETNQLESLTTQFRANASFDEIHLRHGGGGGGWTFGNMAIATSFSDFVSGSSAGLGGGRGALPFTFRSWQREQGLPQNSIRALAQTPDGYLWMGSDDGVARFDGVRFVSFGLREGLRSGSVRELFVDSRGALWIGSASDGLTRWQDNQFTTYTTRDGLPSDSITALTEDNEGRLWIGTEAGLAVWQNGQVSVLDVPVELKGKRITTLFKGRQGTMWIGASGAGIFQYQNKRFTSLTDNSVAGLLQDPHCLLEDQSGRIWIGAGDDFVLCRDGSQWRRYRIPRHLARPYVSALAEEPDGTVWAGSVSEGLFQFKGGVLEPVNASGGLPDNLVESLLVDYEGNLWVGTDSGLSRLRRKSLSVFGPGEGLGYGAVQGLAEVAPGVVWAAKPGDGLYEWTGRNFNRLNTPGFSSGIQFNALLAQWNGGCWVAGTQGIWHFADPSQATNMVDAPMLTGRNVLSLAQNRSGIWAGTQSGELWFRNDNRWEMLTNFTPAHPITALCGDAGPMWVGTDGGGLYQINGVHFGKGNGLLSDSIRALHQDARGALWIGTAGGGLSRWLDGKMTTFTMREGLPDNTISQILEDDADRLWLGCNRGIACVSKQELDELAAGKINAIYPRVFGLADGMLSEECTGGFFPAGMKAKSGPLWFPTLKGIVVVDPRPRLNDTHAPKVALEEVLLDGAPVADFRAAESLRIPPGKHRIELRYAGLSFSAPERVRFRYRLEGLDPDWVEAGMARTAVYNYVPPGEYKFHVVACNSDGVWNEEGASVALICLRHFWQAWWFIGLVTVGLLSAVGGAARFVEKRKLQRQLEHLEQERALERERARIARDLHDDLGSSLTRLSLLSDLARADKDNPTQVEAHAVKISQSAAQTVRALEEIVWAVRPGSDSLQSLVEYIAHFANELFDGAGARCRLDLPHDLPARPLPPEVRHNIFLVVKEALTNALKHAGASEVRVQTKAGANSLEILVQDNGRGFDPQAQPADAERNGMGNMRRRADSIGGTLTVQSAPGKGTAVQLRVNFDN